jgi:hypothetical protein
MTRTKTAAAIVAAGALLATSAVAHAGTRPGSAVPSVSKEVVAKMGTRTSKRVKAEESVFGLTGLPNALATVLLVGASTTAAVVIAKNIAKNDSRG